MNKKKVYLLIFMLILSISLNFYFLLSKKKGNLNNNLVLSNNVDSTVSFNKVKNSFKEKNNIEEIKNINNIEELIDFKKNSNLRQSMLLYSIKNNDKDKWMLYWQEVLENFDYNNLGISKEEYFIYLEKVFDLIRNNKLELSINNKYLLDGGIFFSNGSLEEKIKGCYEYHNLKRKDSDLKKYGFEKTKNIKENIRKCINFSYYYEAVIRNDKSFCNKINDAGTGNNMKGDCLDLLK